MKIDVIIPLFNCEKYISQALDSVLSQTFLPNKILVINDGSTDSGPQIVNEYIKKYPLIEMITKPNGGLSSARNAGIFSSRADWVAFLDSDDSWLPKKLEAQVKQIQVSSFKDIGLVYCDFLNVDADNRPSQEFKLPFNPKALGKCSELLVSGNFILSSGSGVLVKKDCFDRVGFFDEKLKFGEDWDMWIRISEQYSVDYVNQVLVSIRKHSQNMQNQKDEHHLFDFEILKKHYLKHPYQVKLAMLKKSYRTPTKALFDKSLKWLLDNNMVTSNCEITILKLKGWIFRILKENKKKLLRHTN